MTVVDTPRLRPGVPLRPDDVTEIPALGEHDSIVRAGLHEHAKEGNLT